MAIVEKLNTEELEDTTGGQIVKYKRPQGTCYIVVNENKYGQFVTSYTNIEGAKYMCNKCGLSQKVISEQEYKDTYHREPWG